MVHLNASVLHNVLRGSMTNETEGPAVPNVPNMRRGFQMLEVAPL